MLLSHGPIPGLTRAGVGGLHACKHTGCAEDGWAVFQQRDLLLLQLSGKPLAHGCFCWWRFFICDCLRRVWLLKAEGFMVWFSQVCVCVSNVCCCCSCTIVGLGVCGFCAAADLCSVCLAEGGTGVMCVGGVGSGCSDAVWLERHNSSRAAVSSCDGSFLCDSFFQAPGGNCSRKSELVSVQIAIHQPTHNSPSGQEWGQYNFICCTSKGSICQLKNQAPTTLVYSLTLPLTPLSTAWYYLNNHSQAADVSVCTASQSHDYHPGSRPHSQQQPSSGTLSHAQPASQATSR